MTRFRLLLLALLGTGLLAPAGTAQSADDVVTAIDQWLGALRKGKIDVGSRVDVGRDSISRKRGVLPKGALGTVTPERELELMLVAATELPPTDDTVRVVLEAAATGYDGERYATIARPHVVRFVGNAALQRLAAIDAAGPFLRKAAAGELRGVDRKRQDAVRGAALRALPALQDPSTATLAIAALTARGEEVRRGAGDALTTLGTKDHLEALSTAIAAESHGGALRSLARAGRGVLARNTALGESDKRALCDAAIGALGNTTWRADSELIDLLVAARSSRVITALIDVLERYQQEKKKGIKSGNLSGLLKQRAHEALVELTGTALPAEDPARWRQWWDKNAEKFRIAERREKPPEGSGNKTTSGFFGIPVHGTRVVFVIDLSLSMEAKMPHTGTAAGGEQPSRLDVAREEVWNAARKLDADALFNLVLFSEGARSWQKKLVPASASNLKKLRRYLDALECEPYTNLWSGLQVAMEFEKNSDAAADELQLDEIFLLSDGAPTIGELTDSREILNVVLTENRHKEIRINTVFLKGKGSNMDPEAGAGMGPEQLMEQLAKRTGGRYVRR